MENLKLKILNFALLTFNLYNYSMLSVDFIRQNKKLVEEAARNKNRIVDLDKILQLDDERKALMLTIQKLREERNILAKNKPNDETIKKGKEIKEKLKTEEEKLKKIEKELEDLLLLVPNVPLAKVPVGKDASFNRVVKTWGKIPRFDFQPKSHS